MAEAEYTTTSALPLQEIWSFVQDMDNWATFVRGYQSHVKQNEVDSTWVLKGDVGVLARRLEFRVHVTEWSGPSRVSFELTGVNEPMAGAGSFAMEPWTGQEAGAAPPRRGALMRLLEALVRAVLRLFGGAAARKAPAAAAGGAGSRLTFRLRIDPGGPMAPMVNALMKPVMLPAAEDLANQIMARIEEIHGSGRPAPRGA